MPHETEAWVVGGRFYGCLHGPEGTQQNASVVQYAAPLRGGSIAVNSVYPADILVGLRAVRLERMRLSHDCGGFEAEDLEQGSTF